MKAQRIKALLLSYYYFSINSADRMFDVFYWPVLDLLIWGFMTFFIEGFTEVNIVSIILGGIVLWVFVWRSSQDVVVYLLENYWSRNIYHLFISPITSGEVMVSLCLLGFIRSLVSFLVLALLSYGLYGFNVFLFNPTDLLLFVSILLLFAWGVGMMISSLVFLYGSRVQVLAWSTIWIIQPFSCVFYPLSALPHWAASIARILPTTHVFEGLRASMQGLPLSYESLSYAFVTTFLFLIGSSFLVVWSIRMAKKKGTFAKPE